ncbi:MAG TPA: hypothetical protein VH879_11275 [Gemmatimonadales bacterium]|jgi:hypothetical protein
MDDSDVQKLLRLLEEIRDGQRLQLERQAEALTLQRQQLTLVQSQADRAERIQDRAERIQATSASLVGTARKATIILLPIIIVLILYLSWLLFNRLGR